MQVPDKRVIIGLPEWNIGGPCIFAERLVRGLSQLGWDARVLLTEKDTDLIEKKPTPLNRPDGVRFDELPAGRQDSWGLRWEALIRYLEENAPCVYIMVHDWRNNVIAPRLSDRVHLIGLVQADYDLEYSQAINLGHCWNAIVAVSDTIQFNLAETMPYLAPRLVTIRNAVPSLTSLPDKPEDGPLRIVYTGELRHDQKRLGDLAQVAWGLHESGTNFELTLIGDGPYRSELESITAPLIEKGVVRFLGKIPNAQLLEELKTYHVFTLTSQFEGLSISLLEAMSRGCVPVVSRLATQSLAVQDGKNGFSVPVGDVSGFVARMRQLSDDRELLARFSRAAFQTIIDGGYRVEDMLKSYLALFDRIEKMVSEQRYARPRSWMNPPPYRIGKVDILPANTTEEIKYVNHLAIWPNPIAPLESKHPRIQPRVKPSKRLEDYKVLFATPFGQISGVDVFSTHMVRHLRSAGIDASILGYRTNNHVLGLAIADDVPVTEPPVQFDRPMAARWQAMIDFLESLAPCIYVPNYTYEYSCIAPRLSDAVKVLMIAHSDDPMHYEHVARLGWVADGIVGVSKAITGHLARLDPSYLPRMRTIPYGIEVPPEFPLRVPIGDRLRIMFAGRHMVHQKRFQDLADIALALKDRGVPFELTIVGDGPDKDVVTTRLRRLIIEKQVWLPGKLSNDEVGEQLRQHDVFLLPSSYEGLSVGLLEAMSQGTVPVVSAIRSGVPEVIRNGVNGVIVPVGHIQGYADELEALNRDRHKLEAMSHAAYQTVVDGRYTVESMANQYVDLFRTMVGQEFQRPSGPIRPPQYLWDEMETGSLFNSKRRK